MEKQALLKIIGKVQGVFYRANAAEEAEKLNLKGYARNMPDGGVEILLQGEEKQIERFIDWAKKGPDRAKVDEVKVKWEKAEKEFQNFKIF